MIESNLMCVENLNAVVGHHICPPTTYMYGHMHMHVIIRQCVRIMQRMRKDHMLFV